MIWVQAVCKDHQLILVSSADILCILVYGIKIEFLDVAPLYTGSQIAKICDQSDRGASGRVFDMR